MSTVHNFKITRGYSVQVRVELFGVDENGQEFPYPLTNRTVTSTAKPSVKSCVSYDFDVTVEDELNGVILMSMPQSLTETIKEDSLVYDVRIEDSTDPDWSYRALNGTISVDVAITE